MGTTEIKCSRAPHRQWSTRRFFCAWLWVHTRRGVRRREVVRPAPRRRKDRHVRGGMPTRRKEPSSPAGSPPRPPSLSPGRRIADPAGVIVLTPVWRRHDAGAYRPLGIDQRVPAPSAAREVPVGTMRKTPLTSGFDAAPIGTYLCRGPDGNRTARPEIASGQGWTARGQPPGDHPPRTGEGEACASSREPGPGDPGGLYWPRSSGNVGRVALLAVLRTKSSVRPFFENSTAYR